jgi:hypothetical protein
MEPVRLRITLRQMVILIALMAIILGLGVRYSRQWKARRDAIAVHESTAYFFVTARTLKNVPWQTRLKISRWHARRASELRWKIDFDAAKERESEQTFLRWSGQQLEPLIAPVRGGRSVPRPARPPAAEVSKAGTA